MEYFAIEYARMRQKEIEREMKAIYAARLAQPRNLKPRTSKSLIEPGNFLASWGRWLKRAAKPC